jgi:multiple sugar transport system ATP-binding protein
VVARLDPATRITEGENVELWLDARKLHVFDPSTGQNLTLGDSGSPASPAQPAGGDAPAQAGTDASGQDTGSAATPPR